MTARMAIVRAGTIGPDIGYCVLPKLEQVLVDIAQRALDRTLARFAGYAKNALGKMSEAHAGRRGDAGRAHHSPMKKKGAW